MRRTFAGWSLARHVLAASRLRRERMAVYGRYRKLFEFEIARPEAGALGEGRALAISRDADFRESAVPLRDSGSAGFVRRRCFQNDSDCISATAR